MCVKYLDETISEGSRVFPPFMHMNLRPWEKLAFHSQPYISTDALYLTTFPFSLLLLLVILSETSVKTNLNSGGAVSRLYIANANRYDSGNYTCSLGDTAKTTIAVHVLNGRWSECC